MTAGQETVGVRVPDPRRPDLIRRGRVPDRRPQRQPLESDSPTTAEHVLKDLDGRIDLVLDSGSTSIGLESTVLDLTGDVPTVLRPGWITQEVLAEALGEPVDRAAPPVGRSILRSPGQMSVHYAPRRMAFWIERDDFRRSRPVVATSW